MSSESPTKSCDNAETTAAVSVSIIMPVYNEVDAIERSLGSVISQDYPAERLQILVADGMSDDRTRMVVERIIRENPEHDIRLLDNLGRTAASGFNAGLSQATGDVIVRVDGHCEIAPDYLQCCLATARETGAECVGGPMDTKGANAMARAIALAQSARFGVGGVAFRTGCTAGRFVDTLAFGAYQREVFRRLGGYDEELVRNQDDEFNFRLTQAGGKIWLDPSIRSVYYSRASLRRLWRQYFQYGLYKLRVMQKRRAVPSWRHLVPAGFVVMLSISILASVLTQQPWWMLSILGPYATASLLASLHAARGDWATLPFLPLAFSVLHLSYGTGFLAGLWRWRKTWSDRALSHPGVIPDMVGDTHVLQDSSAVGP